MLVLDWILKDLKKKTVKAKFELKLQRKLQFFDLIDQNQFLKGLWMKNIMNGKNQPWPHQMKIEKLIFPSSPKALKNPVFAENCIFRLRHFLEKFYKKNCVFDARATPPPPPS